ncbi:hypothetical protein Noda2021_00190 [Candidatus Dependentiae bacterium Noda2021]|nr:hypothetical protein Noda2021_00190 [Candidatus Dependentiae bacterium Noda2021]
MSGELQERQSTSDRLKIINKIKNKVGILHDEVLTNFEVIKKQFEKQATWSGKIHTITKDGRYIITSESTNFFLNENAPCQELSYLPRGLRAYQDHTGFVTTVALANDNLHAVSCSYDKTLKYWDLRQNKPLCTLSGHTDWVEHAVISKNDANVLSASKDNTLRWWDLKSEKSVYTFTGHTSRITYIAVSPDETKALSCSDDNTIKIWDLKEGKMLHSLNGLTSKATFAIFSPDSSKILSNSENNALTLWDTSTGQKIQNIKGHPYPNIGLMITKDNEKALSISHDFCSLWDLKKGTHIHSIVNDTSKGLPQLMYNANALFRRANSTHHFDNEIQYKKTLVVKERALADLTTGTIYTIKNWSSLILSMPKPKPALFCTSHFIDNSDCPQGIGLLKIVQNKEKKKLLFETSFAKQRLAHYPTSNYLVGK